MHINKNQIIINSVLFIPLLFFVLYLLLPSQNSTIDAYGYANYIRDADSLFLSHHLLYNLTGYLWVSLLKLIGISNTLGALKAMNAIFAALSLLVLGKIFKGLGYGDSKAAVWVLLAGSSWGVMRFATENETYIIPIFFSLQASYFFLLHCTQRKTIHVFLAGFLAAFACLIHQIHFFWWLAMLIALVLKKEFRNSFLYAISAIIVPTGYILVLALYYKVNISVDSLLQFTLRDFYSGSATIGFGFKYIILTAISFIRSFIQVHGYMGNLLSISPWFILGVFGFIVSLIVGLYNIKKLVVSFQLVKSTFGLALIITFVLHLVFAFLSHGNAEFMVMLPFLVVLIISQILTNEVRLVGFLGIAMLIWNISFGLIPLNRFELDGNQMVVNYIQKENTQKGETLFVVYNKPAVDNRVKHYSGANPQNTISATQVKDFSEVTLAIDSAIINGKVVYTDCLLRPKILSRESFVLKNNDEIFKGLNFQKVDSVKTLTGEYFLVKLIP
jgi:hypothetical protein